MKTKAIECPAVGAATTAETANSGNSNQPTANNFAPMHRVCTYIGLYFRFECVFTYIYMYNVYNLFIETLLLFREWLHDEKSKCSEIGGIKNSTEDSFFFF